MPTIDWADEVTDEMRARAADMSELHARVVIEHGWTLDRAAAYGADTATAELHADVQRARAVIMNAQSR